MENNLQFRTIYFKSKDGLLITADWYAADKPIGAILLCHRSHCNRGEYRETAPKLNALGFSCLAIDQRSGMKVFGVINETSALAKQNGLPTGYLDAKPDIEAAADYLYKMNQDRPIILVGSSYSASLALLVARDTDKVKAVAAFSPGEYLKGVNLAEEIAGLTRPVYVTSARKEIQDIRTLVRLIDPKYVTHFEPDVEGFHGSKTLWSTVKGNETYWRSFQEFLSPLD
jgi:alpha-beta hydrolase superfamily lysophospholipase